VETTYYSLTIAVLGIIWVLLTLWLRDRIKRLELYTLFPLLIYSIPALLLALEKKLVIVLLLLVLLYSYYVFKLFRQLNLKDALLLPLTLLTILVLSVYVGG